MKIVFITNMCTHYRFRIFQMLARKLGVDFFFFSKGQESYWSPHLGIIEKGKNFNYLKGFNIAPKLRITPSLVTKLLFGNYDVIIKCTNGRSALPAAFLITKILRKKFILWQTIWYHPQILFHKISYPFLRFIQNHSDALVVYGEHGRKYLTSLGIDESKIFIAWQTVDNLVYNRYVSEDDKNALKRRLGILGKKVILFVGRFERVKGINYLLKAFFQISIKDTVLILIGDGHEKKNIDKLSKRLKIQNRVTKIAFVPNKEIYRYYALSDIFVLPSITTNTVKEPWGLVINEAMNQGCPIVATDAVGAAVGGLVQNGINGYVVKEKNAGELAKAIKKILTDEKLRKFMSEKSREIIKDWTYERMYKGFEDAIDYCTKGKNYNG